MSEMEILIRNVVSKIDRVNVMDIYSIKLWHSRPVRSGVQSDISNIIIRGENYDKMQSNLVTIRGICHKEPGSIHLPILSRMRGAERQQEKEQPSKSYMRPYTTATQPVSIHTTNNVGG